MSDYQPTPPTSTPYTGSSAPQTSTPILSILALIFGIIGVLGGWLFFGGIFALAGVVLGFIGRKREPAAKGFWLTGIITGFVGILELLAVIAFYIVVVAITLHNPGAISTAP